MITEDYVSYETAKLLKDKGFDECTLLSYDKNGNSKDIMRPFLESEEDVRRPTLQMAMKWLRKVHKLHVDIDPSEGNWNPTVLELENWTCAVKFGDNIPIQDSYEQACEAAIKYCLENLI